MSFLMRGRSAWWRTDQTHPHASEPAPQPAAQATGLPVAAQAPEGGTDDLRAAVVRMLTAQGRMLDGWAEAGVLRRKDLWRDLHEAADAVRDVLDLDGEALAEWVAEACETLAEMDKAQAEWEASGEAPRCAVVNIGGEDVRLQGGADMPEPLRDAMADVWRSARQAMAEAKAAERAEIEREIREEIAEEQAAWLPEILHVVWGFAMREHTGTAQLTPWHAEEALRHVPGAVLDAARVRTTRGER